MSGLDVTKLFRVVAEEVGPFYIWLDGKNLTASWTPDAPPEQRFVITEWAWDAEYGDEVRYSELVKAVKKEAKR